MENHDHLVKSYAKRHEGKALRTREAAPELPDALRKKINEYRERREQGREELVENMECGFMGNVEWEKRSILHHSVRPEPRWATRLMAVLFSKRIDEMAHARVMQSDLMALQQYDRNTGARETDILRGYQASLHQNDHGTRSPQCIQGKSQRDVRGNQRTRTSSTERER